MSIDKQESNTTSGEVTSERVSAGVTSEAVTSERVSERVSEGVSFSVSWADLPTVLISCICFVTYIALGFFVSAIGAAIPEIADDLNRENTSLSIIYTARGVGFFIGTFFGTAQNELPVFKLIRTDVLVCIPTLVVALGSFILFILPLKLWVILVVVCVQASMFSFLDVVANIMLMELWGKRVEPWLQALHAFFGVGAVLGPAIVGIVHFRLSNLCLCLICLVPTTIAVVSSCWKRNPQGHDSCDVSSGGYISTPGSKDDEEDVGDDGKISGIPSAANDSDADGSLDIAAPRISNRLRLAFILFYFVYVGLETGFGGWISAYSLDMDVTDSDARAAYLSSIFFFGITVGRLLSVPTAMYVSPTRMMCFLLSLVWLGVIMFTIMTMFQDHATYTQLIVACAVLGLGISSMYPVGLTIAQDYDIVMDSRTISVCCIGAVAGEAVVPMCFGMLMNAFSPAYLTYSTFVVAVIVTSLYVLIHCMFVRTAASSSDTIDKHDGNVEMKARKGTMKGSVEVIAFNPLNCADEEEFIAGVDDRDEISNGSTTDATIGNVKCTSDIVVGTAPSSLTGNRAQWDENESLW